MAVDMRAPLGRLGPVSQTYMRWRRGLTLALARLAGDVYATTRGNPRQLVHTTWAHCDDGTWREYMKRWQLPRAMVVVRKGEVR